jgi:protein gp37
MSDNSAIEWTDATWNPIRARNIKTGKVGWHCEHATTGCEFCYAEGFNKRLGTGLAFKPGLRKDIEIFLDEEMLTLPLRWKKPRMIFVCSMTDLFADFVPAEWIDRMFGVMALAPQHTFQVLTKRAARMRDYLNFPSVAGRIANRSMVDAPIGLDISKTGLMLELRSEPGCNFERWPLPNVWLGTSTERQQEADERIPLLLQTPAAIRFISAEPLLGPIRLTGLPAPRLEIPGPPECRVLDALAGKINTLQWARIARQEDAAGKLNWVIVGGESGPGARPMHPDWARGLRDQCQAAGVAFFFKQWGEHAPVPVADPQALVRGGKMPFGKRRFSFHRVDGYALVKFGKKGAGRHLDGQLHNAMPELAR